MKRLVLLAAVASAFGCRRTEETPGPSASIAIAPGSPWHAERTGDAPMFRGPGDLFVFVTTSKSEDRLPGLSIGTAAGPALTLLNGEFAPMIVPDRTDGAYLVRVEAGGATLAVDFGGAFSAKVSSLGVAPHDWSRIVLDGHADLVLPAGETTVRGMVKGKPSFSERITAWSKPSVEPRPVDRIEIETERRGIVVVETSCPPRLIRPRTRANSSSFVLRLGIARPDFDPLYAPPDAEDATPECAGTATIALPRS